MLETCRFCGKVVVDDSGSRTEDFGIVQYSKYYVCARCAKALEFALGD